MGLQFWCKDDLRNMLLSINVASATTATFANSAEADAYRQGYQEALVAVGLALGLRLPVLGRTDDVRDVTGLLPRL